MARAVGPTVGTLTPRLGPEQIHAIKRASGSGGPIPSNIEWFEALPDIDRERLARTIRRKPSRTLSGVAIVAVMTSPARCPHGVCTYCPGGLEASSPQSYTGEEPSALRGAQFGWDARAIADHRLRVLERLGHPTSKVEAIVMGGTFPSRPKAYRDSVVKGIFDALNGRRASSILEAHRWNESSNHRLTSLTVETRPDVCDGRILPDLLDVGVTRVEIGVECLTDSVLKEVHRAHGVHHVVSATREARDRGLKVAYHVMLGLPGMDPARDLADFRRMFEESDFRPDMLKIYPTLVLPGTGLFDRWRSGEYRPYDTETAAHLIAEMKRFLPPWVRIQRIQRDIPARLIADGVRTSNLREVAKRLLVESGGRCRCLRCREPGRSARPDPTSFLPNESRYEAGHGTEIFLSSEEPKSDTVAAFLRLRFPSNRTEGGLEAPVIRELKVLGSEVPVGARPDREIDYQHRGFGRALVERAETVARSEGFRRIFVMAAVGTRAYFRTLGFELAAPHMVKALFA